MDVIKIKGINDDACRKHGEPLYTGWCKACAAEAITRAKDEVSAEWKHLRDRDGEEYCRLRDVLDETRKERDSTAEQFLSLVERLNDDIAELRRRAEAAESALRAIQEIADEDLRRGDHPSQTGLFQIEATARAALASRHPA